MQDAKKWTLTVFRKHEINITLDYAQLELSDKIIICLLDIRLGRSRILLSFIPVMKERERCTALHFLRITTFL